MRLRLNGPTMGTRWSVQCDGAPDTDAKLLHTTLQATVERIEGSGLTVRLDGSDHREVRFDLKDYAQIDHGYAATIHKAQGMTVDRTHVLATPGMDAHGSYVALSRHPGDAPGSTRADLSFAVTRGGTVSTKWRKPSPIALCW